MELGLLLDKAGGAGVGHVTSNSMQTVVTGGNIETELKQGYFTFIDRLREVMVRLCRSMKRWFSTQRMTSRLVL